jgi:hypothetical protein
MSTGIIDTIKRVALNAYEASNPVKLVFGRVISVDPVKIQISQYLTLTQEYLVINGALSVGDEVTLIRCQGGQKYVVLGTRTVTITNDINTGGIVTEASQIKTISGGNISDWITSMEGQKPVEWGSGSGTQCVELPKYYIEKCFGVSTKNVALGNGNQMYYMIPKKYPDLFEKINYSNNYVPQPGDILSLVGTQTQYGHAMIVKVVVGTTVYALEQWKGAKSIVCSQFDYKNPKQNKRKIIGAARPKKK